MNKIVHDYDEYIKQNSPDGYQLFKQISSIYKASQCYKI